MKKKELVKEIEKSLLQGAQTGLTKLVGYNEKGEPEFSLTEKGRKYVEAMPFDSEENSVKWLQEWDKNHH